MNIGIPGEIKNNENRVGLTPAGVRELKRSGHRIFIEKDAGLGSGIDNEEYISVGGEVLPDLSGVYQAADMIIKVKEPTPDEYDLIRPGQLVFTFFHFASNEVLTRAMMERKAICLAYETVEKADRSLPLLIPMSEVAGRMAIQEGAKYLEKSQGGRGILLGGVPGVLPAQVLILGGGVVGTQAARMAAGLGARVTIVDINLERLRYLADIMPANVNTLISGEYNIRRLVTNHDLIVGAVLVHGARAPHLVTRDMLSLMRPGTVVVDVAVDQGGCIESCRPTTHDNPTYILDGVLHYCVANMPGAVPYTSTLALNNATLPYAIELADKGWRQACLDNYELRMGLNIVEGAPVYRGVAEAFGLQYRNVEDVLRV